jgi:fucose 4-O-acetylase-like acetyltransferase
MNKFFEEIRTTRGIAIILVVLGHSFPDSDFHIYNHSMIIKYMEQFIYSFHMPLFMFMSGFVSFKILKISGLKSKLQCIKKKFFRLMIPYFILSVPALILKYLFSDVAHHKFDFSNSLLSILTGGSPYGGSWFLYTLFIISIIFILLNSINLEAMFLLSFVLHFLLQEISGPFYNVFQYLFFFYFGLIVYKHYESIEKIVRNKMTLFFGITLLVLLNIINFNSQNYYFNFIISLIGIITSLSLGLFLLNFYKVNNIIGKISDFSYDIYLISWFVQVPIRVILFTKMNLNYNFVVVNMFIWGLVIPYIISKFVIRKINILNIILLGNYKDNIKINNLNKSSNI